MRTGILRSPQSGWRAEGEQIPVRPDDGLAQDLGVGHASDVLRGSSVLTMGGDALNS